MINLIELFQIKSREHKVKKFNRRLSALEKKLKEEETNERQESVQKMDSKFPDRANRRRNGGRLGSRRANRVNSP